MTSTGSAWASWATVTLGSGTLRTWLATMSCTWSNHQALSWLSTCPLKGIAPSTLSKADTRSVVMRNALAIMHVDVGHLALLAGPNPVRSRAAGRGGWRP